MTHRYVALSCRRWPAFGFRHRRHEKTSSCPYHSMASFILPECAKAGEACESNNTPTSCHLERRSEIGFSLSRASARLKYTSLAGPCVLARYMYCKSLKPIESSQTRVRLRRQKYLTSTWVQRARAPRVHSTEANGNCAAYLAAVC